MSDTDGQNSAKTIKIFVALIVPDIFAFAFDNGNWFLVIRRNRREKKFFMLADGFGKVGSAR